MATIFEEEGAEAPGSSNMYDEPTDAELEAAERELEKMELALKAQTPTKSPLRRPSETSSSSDDDLPTTEDWGDDKDGRRLKAIDNLMTDLSRRPKRRQTICGLPRRAGKTKENPPVLSQPVKPVVTLQIEDPRYEDASEDTDNAIALDKTKSLHRKLAAARLSLAEIDRFCLPQVRENCSCSILDCVTEEDSLAFPWCDPDAFCHVM